MSSTNRGSARRPGDHYATPAWAVDVILPFLPLDGIVLEPGCGEGAIIERLCAGGVPSLHIRAVELDADLAAQCEAATLVRPAVADFLTWSPAPGDAPIRTVLCNPPYSLAREFIEHALAIAPEAEVAFLLRLAFLEGQRRADLFARCMPDVYVLAKRPSFTGGGVDSCAYAWMVWWPPTQRRVGSIRVLGATP